MTMFYCLKFETPQTRWARSPYLYPPGIRWPSFTPRHRVPFSSPPTVEVFELASTGGSRTLFFLTPRQQQHWNDTTFSLLNLLLCAPRFRGNVFSDPLLRNGLHYNVVLLLHAMIALLSNGSCLHSHRVATGLYVTALPRDFPVFFLTRKYVTCTFYCRFIKHMNVRSGWKTQETRS
jgi:hypothetical protein